MKININVNKFLPVVCGLYLLIATADLQAAVWGGATPAPAPVGSSGGTSAIAGESRNLVITRPSVTTLGVTADEIVVQTALGGTSFVLTSVSSTLNAATNGANGLDTGSLATSTWYYVYAIYNPTSLTQATLLSTSVGTVYGGANMPSGYTMSSLIGAIFANGSAQFPVFTQYDKEVFYQTPIALVTNQTPNFATLTSLGIGGNSIPPTICKTISGTFSQIPVAAATVRLQVAGDATGTGLQEGPTITSALVTGIGTISLNYRQVPVLTSNTIFISMGNTGTGSTNSFTINSFTIR